MEPDISAPYRDALAAIARRADAAIAAGEFTARPLIEVLDMARDSIQDGPVLYVCDHAVDNPLCRHHS